jgi:CheY-like chemotaxis protein
MGGVLVIGDGLISNMLRLAGHSIIEANSPLEALEIVKLRKSEIVIVVTHLAMEPMSGLVFATRLHRQRTPIPVFFIADPSIAGAIRDSLGRNGMIVKPFLAVELTREVGKFLARSRRALSSEQVVPALNGKAVRDDLPAHIRTMFRSRPSR